VEQEAIVRRLFRIRRLLPSQQVKSSGVFAGLFPVVIPLGAAPLLLSLTADPRGSRWWSL
jgi:hypothetical protein